MLKNLEKLLASLVVFICTVSILCSYVDDNGIVGIEILHRCAHVALAFARQNALHFFLSFYWP